MFKINFLTPNIAVYTPSYPLCLPLFVIEREPSNNKGLIILGGKNDKYIYLKEIYIYYYYNSNIRYYPYNSNLFILYATWGGFFTPFTPMVG